MIIIQVSLTLSLIHGGVDGLMSKAQGWTRSLQCCSNLTRLLPQGRRQGMDVDQVWTLQNAPHLNTDVNCRWPDSTHPPGKGQLSTTSSTTTTAGDAHLEF